MKNIIYCLATALVMVVGVGACMEGPTEEWILFDSRMGPTPASPGLGPAKGQEIWLIRSDGSGLWRLTESPSEDTRYQTPRWSPDGRLIAFSSTRHAPSPENTDADIYVMNRDGSRLRRLTYGPQRCGSPDWSPDGMQIAFDSNRDGHGRIYVMDGNGSNVRRLTTDQRFPSSTGRLGLCGHRMGSGSPSSPAVTARILKSTSLSCRRRT